MYNHIITNYTEVTMYLYITILTYVWSYRKMTQWTIKLKTYFVHQKYPDAFGDYHHVVAILLQNCINCTQMIYTI